MTAEFSTPSVCVHTSLMNMMREVNYLKHLFFNSVLCNFCKLNSNVNKCQNSCNFNFSNFLCNYDVKNTDFNCKYLSNCDCNCLCSNNLQCKCSNDCSVLSCCDSGNFLCSKSCLNKVPMRYTNRETQTEDSFFKNVTNSENNSVKKIVQLNLHSETHPVGLTNNQESEHKVYSNLTKISISQSNIKTQNSKMTKFQENKNNQMLFL